MIDQKITQEDIVNALYSTGAWKALGLDLLLVGFLKAYRLLLYKVLACITIVSLQLGHFLSQFQVVKVVVLTKPRKTVQQYQIVGVYYPILLLNILSKTIKIIVSYCITDTTKIYRLLLETQIGNRPYRLIELIVKLTINTTYIAQKYNTIILLLQLDIQSTFDIVNYIQLLFTLQ